ncbi:MAG: flagellar hook-basal body complex protein, partial [Pseudomonadota bacterium]
VTVQEPGQEGETELGQIELARFVNKGGLQAIGDNLFVQTEASGGPELGNPGDPGFGNVLQGYLEEANVNPVTEIADLIAAQRAYEMNSRTVKASDEMLAATANLR